MTLNDHELEGRARRIVDDAWNELRRGLWVSASLGETLVRLPDLSDAFGSARRLPGAPAASSTAAAEAAWPSTTVWICGETYCIVS